MANDSIQWLLYNDHSPEHFKVMVVRTADCEYLLLGQEFTGIKPKHYLHEESKQTLLVFPRCLNLTLLVNRNHGNHKINLQWINKKMYWMKYLKTII